MEVEAVRIKFSENFLDTQFQKVLLPTRIVQHMFFLSKFSIKSNCVMPNGILYNIVSALGMLFFIFLNFNAFIFKNILQLFRISKFVSISLTINYVLCVAGYILFYFRNVFSSTKHVRMIIMIQKSLRIIHFDKYKNIIFDNWVYIIRHFLAYFVLIFLEVNVLTIIYFFSLVYFDVYMSYGVCLSKLLCGGLLAWISEVQYYTRISLNINNEEEKRWTKLFQVYTDLMEAFSIFKDVFQVPIFFTTCDTLFHTLLYVQTVLFIDKMPSSEIHYRSSFLLASLYWLAKNMILISMFSYRCEKFYKIVEEVNEVCCSLLSTNQELEGSKRLCKNILRLNRVNFEKMNVFKAFMIDSSFPKKLASLTANYVIVILQFTLQ